MVRKLMFLMACILLAVTVQSQVVYIHFTDTFRTQVVNSSAEYLLFEKGYKEQGTLRINLKDEIYWPFIVVAKKYRRDTIYTETLVLEDYFVD